MGSAQRSDTVLEYMCKHSCLPIVSKRIFETGKSIGGK